jgi:hypothetical protein
MPFHKGAESGFVPVLAESLKQVGVGFHGQWLKDTRLHPIAP